MIVRTLSSCPAVRTASWCAFGAPASSHSTNLVPIHTAVAPYINAAATPCPLKIPPAAMTCTSFPSGLFLPRHICTTVGTSTDVGTSPVWPPPSPPCAPIRSAPASRQRATCLGWPIMFMYSTPAVCKRSTTALGGTPMAETKSRAPESMMMVTSSSSLPLV